MVRRGMGKTRSGARRHSISFGRLRLKPVQISVTLLILIAAGIVYSLFNQPVEGEVVEVVDWDTITVYTGGKRERVRLLGIDTPELHHPQRGEEPLGREAGDYTRERLLGLKVMLIRDPESDDRDRYGRLLRFVELPDGTDFSSELVERGLARVMTGYNCSRKPDYLRAEEGARERGLGIWGIEERKEAPGKN